MTTVVRSFVRALPAILLALGLWSAEPARAGGEVNVYSYREPDLINPLLKAFEEKTGIAVNIIFASAGLIERIEAEGENSPADVLLTNESGLLIQAMEGGITQPVSAPDLESEIPAALRDPAGNWFGLTRRARIIYASRERVAQDAISYEELADPKWKGKICSRSGQHTYNIALIASMIAHHGADEAEHWLKAVKENLAHRPAGGDREQVKAVYAGECDLAIGNTYYMAAMLKDEKHPEQKEWAQSVKMLFPNAGDRGTHVNISGAAIMKHAPNRDNALKLISYLASQEGQALYASLNGEYPVNPAQPASDLVRSWGELKPDALPLSEIAKLRRQASELVDKVGFDDGPSS